MNWQANLAAQIYLNSNTLGTEPHSIHSALTQIPGYLRILVRARGLALRIDWDLLL